MEKRQRRRFHVPGITASYKSKNSFWKKSEYSDEYYPVMGMSRRGLRFISKDRLKKGAPIQVRLSVPGSLFPFELKAIVRWASNTSETPPSYMTGVEFAPFGLGKNDNATGTLSFIKKLESMHITPECSPSLAPVFGPSAI
jgi:hypothetical protein